MESEISCFLANLPVKLFGMFSTVRMRPTAVRARTRWLPRPTGTFTVLSNSEENAVIVFTETR